MKLLLFVFVVTICTNTYAQVLEEESREVDIRLSSDTNYEIIYEAKADEVRGISSENDGTMCFVMGDNTKKGLYNQITVANNTRTYIVKKGDLYGLVNNKAEIIVDITYDSIFSNYYTHGIGFVVKQHGKYGKITSSGEIIIAIAYTKIIAGDQNITLVENNTNNTELIINHQQKSLLKNIEYAELYQNLTILKSEGKFGILKKDVLIVPFEYDSIFLPIQDPGNSWIGNMTKKPKNWKTPNPLVKTYQNVSCLTIQKGTKFGLVNSEGELIYTAENDAAYTAENLGYYSVKKGTLYGIYFFTGKTKKRTAVEFDRIYTDGYGAIMASKNNKMGIFNLEGEQITPFVYDNDYIAQFSGIGYRVTKNKKRGVIDKLGNEIIPPIYDDVSISFNLSDDGFKVKTDNTYGIINKDGKVIVPVKFAHISSIRKDYIVVTPQGKMGMYDKNGNNLVPAKYKNIKQTATYNSTIVVLEDMNGSFNFLNKTTKISLPERVIEYGYVMDESKLKSPIGLMGLLYLKSKNGKIGLLNELNGTLDVPMIYDEIIQYTELTEGHLCFSVRKGKNYGLINEKNEVLIPIIYSAISLTLATSTADLSNNPESQPTPNDFQVVVAKGNKYGTVNLKNEVVIPLQYSYLQRISYSGLFKAKTENIYQIIDKHGKPICKNTFDEVANFEQIDIRYSQDDVLQALTFSNGKMLVINSKGNFISDEKPMQPHNGYETFDELKFALISALESKEDSLLKVFVAKITPSEHIMYFLNQRPNLFGRSTIYADINNIKKRYLHVLLKFKEREWNADKRFGYPGYNRASLYVDDYTKYSNSEEIVTNIRTTDHAFGDPLLEKILRDAIKINGYWISTYFMKSSF